MHKATKGVLNAIKILSAKLPVVNNHTHEVHFIKGSELIEEEVFDIDGVKVIPERMYIRKYPVILASNHYRRMKRAFERNGNDGINYYLNGLLKLSAEKKNKLHNVYRSFYKIAWQII